MFWYRNIATEAVDAELRLLAERAAVASAKELGVPCPQITWYEPSAASGQGAWGVAISECGHSRGLQRDRIWINVRQTSRESLVETTSHEVRHVWQWSTGRAAVIERAVTDIERKRTEWDAEEYGIEFARRFFAGDPPQTAPAFLVVSREKKQLALDAFELLKRL